MTCMTQTHQMIIITSAKRPKKSLALTIKRSQPARYGFDADVIDDPHYMGIRAFPARLLSLWMDDLLIYCNSAIETYNKENGTNLKVVEVVKAVYEPIGRYQDFHLTFTAKDSDSDNKDAAAATYQARVYVICTDFPVEVKLCRLAPASYQI